MEHSTPDDMMSVMLATGFPFGEAVCHVAALHGVDAVPQLTPHFRSFAQHGRPVNEIMRELDRVAECFPAAANGWLAWGFRRGWIHSDPQGVSYRLDGRDWITRLPVLPGAMTVTLDGCRRLHRLPKGIYLHMLSLRGCESWDGRIPDDARLATVITDRHASGISLEKWRKHYPHGARAGV